MSRLSLMLPVPLWFVAVIAALSVAWQFAMWRMAVCLKELYALYLAGRARQEAEGNV